MKRFILFIALLFVGLAYASAQTVTYPRLLPGETYLYTATDYTLAGTTARVFVYPAQQHYKATQDYVIKLDSVAGGDADVVVVLQGQKSSIKADWTTIATATWYGKSIDTTIILSNTTANRYRNFRATVTAGGAGTRRVLDQEFKLWLE